MSWHHSEETDGNPAVIDFKHVREWLVIPPDNTGMPAQHVARPTSHAGHESTRCARFSSARSLKGNSPAKAALSERMSSGLAAPVLSRGGFRLPPGIQMPPCDRSARRPEGDTPRQGG